MPCAVANNLERGICPPSATGTGNTVKLIEEQEGLNVPAPAADSMTVSDNITLPAGTTWRTFSRYDRRKGKLTGAKQNGQGSHNWGFEMFVPGLDDDTLLWLSKITHSLYEALCVVTDANGNQFIYRDCVFSYSFDSQTVNDDGEAGTIVTVASKMTDPPYLYTGEITDPA